MSYSVFPALTSGTQQDLNKSMSETNLGSNLSCHKVGDSGHTKQSQFLLLHRGGNINSNTALRLVWELTNYIQVKHLAQCLPQETPREGWLWGGYLASEENAGLWIVRLRCSQAFFSGLGSSIFLPIRWMVSAGSARGLWSFLRKQVSREQSKKSWQKPNESENNLKPQKLLLCYFLNVK